MSVGFAIGMTVCDAILCFQIFQILMRLPKHPDREREFEVGICDGARLVEDTFNGLLWPRTILSFLLGDGRKYGSKGRHTESWRDMTRRTPRSIGSG